MRTPINTKRMRAGTAVLGMVLVGSMCVIAVAGGHSAVSWGSLILFGITQTGIGIILHFPTAVMALGILLIGMAAFVKHRAGHWALAAAGFASLVVAALVFITETEHADLTFTTAIPFGCVSLLWIVWLIRLGFESFR